MTRHIEEKRFAFPLVNLDNSLVSEKQDALAEVSKYVRAVLEHASFDYIDCLQCEFPPDY